MSRMECSRNILRTLGSYLISGTNTSRWQHSTLFPLHSFFSFVISLHLFLLAVGFKVGVAKTHPLAPVYPLTCCSSFWLTLNTSDGGWLCSMSAADSCGPVVNGMYFHQKVQGLILYRKRSQAPYFKYNTYVMCTRCRLHQVHHSGHSFLPASVWNWRFGRSSASCRSGLWRLMDCDLLSSLWPGLSQMG